jgi:hypothetical protein
MTLGLLFAGWLLVDACGSGNGSNSPTVTTTEASATLAWDRSNDPSVLGYKIYYGKASGIYQPPLDAGLNTSYTISNLQSGTTYYFAITSNNSWGESGYSDEISANTR